MVGTLVGAAAPPLLATTIRGYYGDDSEHWANFFVGLFFAIFYLVTMYAIVFGLQERKVAAEEVVPLIPSMIRCFQNEPFALLLFCWLIDYMGWFACAASMPFFLKYVIMPGKHSMDKVGVQLDDEIW